MIDRLIDWLYVKVTNDVATLTVETTLVVERTTPHAPQNVTVTKKVNNNVTVTKKATNNVTVTKKVNNNVAVTRTLTITLPLQRRLRKTVTGAITVTNKIPK